jgi:predicted permease
MQAVASLAVSWGFAPPQPPSPPAPDLGAVGITLFSSFGCMLLGVLAVRSGLLDTAARKGIASLYAQLVFPTMVFVGVADIKLETVDSSMLLVMLASKATLAALVIAYAVLTMRPTHGAATMAHAAAWAMAASHSFDVTLGVPLARVLHPNSVAYAYLNQSVQLVLVNPVLIILMESGRSGGKGGMRVALRAVATNPLVVMTIAGLVAGQICPAGLPAPVAALSRQVANAGPFLGFVALGFAMATLGGTSTSQLGVSAGLCAFKLVAMPALYALYAALFACDASPALLTFLGTLPASASVYSLTLTKDLSPTIVGPLVPASMLLCVALNLLPLWPAADAFSAADVLRAGIGLLGLLLATRAKSAGLPPPPKRD